MTLARRRARVEEQVRRIWERECQRPLREARARLHRQLAVHYRTRNRRCYGGELPSYKVRLVPHSPLFHLNEDAEGRCDFQSQTIFIFEDLTTDDCHDVLRHEMVHVKAQAGHGHAFREELRRLVSLGDEWASHELARYERTRENVLRLLREIADRYPLMHWTGARRKATRFFGLGVSDLLRLAPDARAEWQRLTRQARPKSPCVRSHAPPPAQSSR